MTTLLILLVLLAIIPFLIILYLCYLPPRWLIAYLNARYPDVLFNISTTRKLLALTIDDGPSEYTLEILDVLRKHNARATFFVIGSHTSGREDCLRDLVQHGNELANHGLRNEPARSLSKAELRNQITDVQNLLNAIYQSTGQDHVPPRYYRPGSGFFNTDIRNLMQELGYQLVLGNVYPHDPQIPFARLNAWHVLNMATNGSIIVCHDCRSWTVQMLELVLPELRRRQYEIVTVSELLRRTT